MRAAVVREYGGPDVIEVRDVPEPVAGPGEVVVDVSVAEINFIETQFRRGYTPGPPLPEPPYVPGGGVAGHVSAIGDGVDPAWAGRRVVTRTIADVGGDAERALAPAGGLVPVPDAIGLDTAVTLLNDGSTAIGLIEEAGVGAGDRVLVEAAAGGLGGLLARLALGAGAQVIGAARGAAKLARIRDDGALAVDYTAPGWAERVRELAGGGVDLAFDGVGGAIGRAGYTTVRRGGRFSIHGAASGAPTVIPPEEAARDGVTILGLDQLMRIATGVRARAARALDEAAAGRLPVTIGLRTPLTAITAAHKAVENRDVVGKTLLTVRP